MKKILLLTGFIMLLAIGGLNAQGVFTWNATVNIEPNPIRLDQLRIIWHFSDGGEIDRLYSNSSYLSGTFERDQDYPAIADCVLIEVFGYKGGGVAYAKHDNPQPRPQINVITLNMMGAVWPDPGDDELTP